MVKKIKAKEIDIKELVYSVTKSDKNGYWIFEVSKLKRKNESKTSDERVLETHTVRAKDYESALIAGKKKIGVK